MATEVIRKIKGSKGLVKEMKANPRYRIISERKLDNGEFLLEVAYVKEEIRGGVRKQTFSDRVEVTVPEPLLKGYYLRGYKLIGMTREGKNVHAVLEK